MAANSHGGQAVPSLVSGRRERVVVVGGGATDRYDTGTRRGLAHLRMWKKWHPSRTASPPPGPQTPPQGAREPAALSTASSAPMPTRVAAAAATIPPDAAGERDLYSAPDDADAAEPRCLSPVSFITHIPDFCCLTRAQAASSDDDDGAPDAVIAVPPALVNNSIRAGDFLMRLPTYDAAAGHYGLPQSDLTASAAKGPAEPEASWGRWPVVIWNAAHQPVYVTNLHTLSVAYPHSRLAAVATTAVLTQQALVLATHNDVQIFGVILDILRGATVAAAVAGLGHHPKAAAFAMDALDSPATVFVFERLRIECEYWQLPFKIPSALDVLGGDGAAAPTGQRPWLAKRPTATTKFPPTTPTVCALRYLEALRTHESLSDRGGRVRVAAAPDPVAADASEAWGVADMPIVSAKRLRDALPLEYRNLYADSDVLAYLSAPSLAHVGLPLSQVGLPQHVWGGAYRRLRVRDEDDNKKQKGRQAPPATAVGVSSRPRERTKSASSHRHGGDLWSAMLAREGIARRKQEATEKREAAVVAKRQRVASARRRVEIRASTRAHWKDFVERARTNGKPAPGRVIYGADRQPLPIAGRVLPEDTAASRRDEWTSFFGWDKDERDDRYVFRCSSCCWRRRK